MKKKYKKQFYRLNEVFKISLNFFLLQKSLDWKFKTLRNVCHWIEGLKNWSQDKTSHERGRCLKYKKNVSDRIFMHDIQVSTISFFLSLKLITIFTNFFFSIVQLCMKCSCFYCWANVTLVDKFLSTTSDETNCMKNYNWSARNQHKLTETSTWSHSWNQNK